MDFQVWEVSVLDYTKFDYYDITDIFRRALDLFFLVSKRDPTGQTQDSTHWYSFSPAVEYFG
jgi:hypothetical protein